MACGQVRTSSCGRDWMAASTSTRRSRNLGITGSFVWRRRRRADVRGFALGLLGGPARPARPTPRTRRQDIFTLLNIGHLYFALTSPRPRLDGGSDRKYCRWIVIRCNCLREMERTEHAWSVEMCFICVSYSTRIVGIPTFRPAGTEFDILPTITHNLSSYLLVAKTFERS